MTLEINNSEVVIKFTSNMSDLVLQELIDFINLKEFKTKSKATQNDADLLAQEVNKNMMENFLKQRN